MVTRAQLLALGLNPDAITHRLERGRLHLVRRGVYAIGSPKLTLTGHWNAAVLSCGPGAALSHLSAAALWGLIAPPHAGDAGAEDPIPVGAGASSEPGCRIDVSVPSRSGRRPSGIVLHRRPSLAPADVTRRDRIPVTTPACTLVDIATVLGRDRLERAVNGADKLGLLDPERLRAAVDELVPRNGTGLLRELLDRRTFVLTDSELERRFLPIARVAGLGRPQTGQRLEGFKVDFFWPELGLVVETDGLRYHRTASQQARDRERDQALTVAGFMCLRFTHAQVRFEPEVVRRTLTAVAARLRHDRR